MADENNLTGNDENEPETPVVEEPVVETPVVEDTTEADHAAEFEALKARAKTLGINHHPSIGYETLKERVRDHVNDHAQAEPEDVRNSEVIAELNRRKAAEEATKLIKDEGDRKLAEARDKAQRLVRVQVMQMDPLKKNYEGEYFSVSNSVAGTTTKYVHFGAPWHVSQMFVDMLKEKKYLSLTAKKLPGAGGRTEQVRKLVPAYNVEILDPLTEEELKELARRQPADVDSY